MLPCGRLVFSPKAYSPKVLCGFKVLCANCSKMAHRRPVEAARRSRRPSQRKRFYDNATAIAADGGFAIRLDGKPVRTPAGRTLAAPTLALAQAIAAEWNAQHDVIDPAKMPLTRLANSIIDGVCDHPAPVVAEVEKYLASDLVCYRAASPNGLVERQAQAWDPILEWATRRSVRHSRSARASSMSRSREALSGGPCRNPRRSLAARRRHSVTTLTGSALIALALARGRLTAEEAWRAAHVDEDWNIEQWGGDEPRWSAARSVLPSCRRRRRCCDRFSFLLRSAREILCPATQLSRSPWYLIDPVGAAFAVAVGGGNGRDGAIRCDKK